MRLALIHIWKRFEHYLVCKIVLQFLFVEHIDCLLLEQGISNQLGFFYKIGKMTYFLSDDTSLWCWFNITLILYQCHNACGMIVTLMQDMIVTPWHYCDIIVTWIWHECDMTVTWVWLECDMSAGLQECDINMARIWHWWWHSNTSLTQ